VYLHRESEKQLKKLISHFPVVAITGPRQCGKSTLIKYITESYAEKIYLDLERQRDLEKLDDAESFFTYNKNNLICIDEIQRKPELFPIIRSLVDEWDRPSCFLVSGSASRDMLKQSSETLAGRIAYKRLTPFLYDELDGKYSLKKYLYAGGFPKSILEKDNEISYIWR
jgi:predicted AAA+ superfamily ATPase